MWRLNWLLYMYLEGASLYIAVEKWMVQVSVGAGI